MKTKEHEGTFPRTFVLAIPSDLGKGIFEWQVICTAYKDDNERILVAYHVLDWLKGTVIVGWEKDWGATVLSVYMALKEAITDERKEYLCTL
jgi:hypothetical protein